MDECRHPTIIVFAEASGPGRMWACAKCGIRFYPACQTCVSVGHRNETHTATLDLDSPETVERLARALHRDGEGSCLNWEPGYEPDELDSEMAAHGEEAAAILAALREQR